MRLVTIVLSLTLFAAGALAHSDHGVSNLPPLDQERIEEVADGYVEQLVAGEQIPASWSDAERMPSVEKEIEQAPVWRIHYINEQIDEAEERELFLFLTPQGDFLGASHVDESS
jgi:hypothetical protein